MKLHVHKAMFFTAGVRRRELVQKRISTEEYTDKRAVARDTHTVLCTISLLYHSQEWCTIRIQKHLNLVVETN